MAVARASLVPAGFFPTGRLPAAQGVLGGKHAVDDLERGDLVRAGHFSELDLAVDVTDIDASSLKAAWRAGLDGLHRGKLAHR